jgi:hypothetical protein
MKFDDRIYAIEKIGNLHLVKLFQKLTNKWTWINTFEYFLEKIRWFIRNLLHLEKFAI